MLIAVLGIARGSVGRNVEFSRGTFTAEGLGEVSLDDLRQFDAVDRLDWVSEDMRELALSYSPDSRAALTESVCIADAQLRLAVETEVVFVPAHRVGSKTEAEIKRIIGDMTARGWILVEDSRMGAAGGRLTFQRAEPLDPEVLAAISFAG
jgi:hypothetical protein